MENQNRRARYLGVDLGGTKLMVGEMDAGGTLLRFQKYPSGLLTQRAALELIERALDDFLDGGRPDAAAAAIGVDCPASWTTMCAAPPGPRCSLAGGGTPRT